ncbi:MAG: recombinase family protein [Bacillota bacterium]
MPNKRAVVYARYSTDNQTENSIDGQISVCEDYALKNDLIIINHYIDRALSGSTDKRPDFQKMMRDSYDNKFDYVLVYKLDRFSRDEYDDIVNERILNQNGVKRLSATEYLPDAPEGIILKSIMRAYNQYYAAEAQQKIIRGLDENVKKGLMVGGSVTWGYTMENKKYIVNEEIAPNIRLIFEMYLQNKTLYEIINELNRLGITNSKQKPFKDHQHISKILHNKRYIGTFIYKGIEYSNYLPSIIDEGIFYRVQKMIGKNATTPGKIRNIGRYLLSGKLYCGHCDSPMVGISGTGKSTKVYNYYSCANRRIGACDKENEPKDYLEDYVVQQTINHVLNDENLEPLINRIIEVQCKKELSDDLALEGMKKQFTHLKKQIENVTDAVKEGLYSKTLATELNSLENRKEDLDLEIKKYEAKIPIKMSKDVLLFFFSSFKKRELTESLKAQIIDSLVHKVVVFDDKLYIAFNTSKNYNKDISIDYIKNNVRMYETQHHQFNYTKLLCKKGCHTQAAMSCHTQVAMYFTRKTINPVTFKQKRALAN